METNQIVEAVQQVFFWIGVIVSAASVIVKATPTQKDDAILAKVIKILDAFSVFNPNGTETIKKTDAAQDKADAGGEK